MKLAAKAHFFSGAEPILALVEKQCNEDLFQTRNIARALPQLVYLQYGNAETPPAVDQVILPRDMQRPVAGDIIRLNPRANEARYLYRRESKHNVLFFTERCNSRCVMCSQPPRNVDDGYLADDILCMIPWMAKDTTELGISGGEPTLYFNKLIEVIESARQHLARTSLHMLSNGRLFSYVKYAQRVAATNHHDLMIGIPLYADIASAHDFVVQAKGAFEQTLFGILNLARFNVRIELRVVIHRETYSRLPQLARFIVRNLPFADQVAFMGLEVMGYAKSNISALWIDPSDYQQKLMESVLILDDAGLCPVIFNHQLCALAPTLRPFARNAISDWKNVYLPECNICQEKDNCGGFFSSALGHIPKYIFPLASNSGY